MSLRQEPYRFTSMDVMGEDVTRVWTEFCEQQKKKEPPVAQERKSERSSEEGREVRLCEIIPPRLLLSWSFTGTSEDWALAEVEHERRRRDERRWVGVGDDKRRVTDGIKVCLRALPCRLRPSDRPAG